MRSFVLLLLAACSSPEPTSLPMDAVGPRASLGGFEVQVRARPAGTFSGDELTSLTLRGRTSDALNWASSWVPDDAFGSTTFSGTGFDVTLTGGHELNTILSGLPIYVDLETATGDYTASIEARTELRVISGVAVRVSDEIHPVFFDDPVDNLRYRALVTTTTPMADLEVTAARGNNPTITRLSDTQWALDWTYASLMAAGVPGPGAAPVVVRGFDANGSFAGSSTARVSVSVGEVDITDMDPWAAWPPVCETAVDDCLVDTWGDVGACGDFRPVLQCRFADPCDLEPMQPVDLDAVMVTGVQEAAAAWPQSCNTGGQWCGLTAVETYQLPRCLDGGTTFEDVVDEVVALSQPQSYHVWSWGTELDATGISNHYMFSSNYAGGPELLESIYAQVGSRDVQGWLSTVEIPCPNCHDFEDYMVLWFPEVGRVVTVSSTFGYDS